MSLVTAAQLAATAARCPNIPAASTLLLAAFECFDTGTRDERELAEAVCKCFDDEGPYHFAKRLGLLVNNSGEELAIQFMSYWNNTYYTRY